MHPYKKLVDPVFSKEKVLKGYTGLFFLGEIVNEDERYENVMKLLRSFRFEEVSPFFNYHTHKDNIIFFLVLNKEKKFIVSVFDHFELLLPEYIIDIIPLEPETPTDISYALDVN